MHDFSSKFSIRIFRIREANQLFTFAHTFQVSTGQHMQLTGDLKPVVSVAAQQGMYFNQQQTQNQAGPAANQTDTYCSVSQSQTINFTQQSLRQRAAAAAAAAAAAGGVPQPGAPGPGARGHPQQVPPGQVDQHQHAKLLQQQQLMRAQQVRRRGSSGLSVLPASNLALDTRSPRLLSPPLLPNLETANAISSGICVYSPHPTR